MANACISEYKLYGNKGMINQLFSKFEKIFHADFVVLVTEPTPFGLSDLKQTVDTLKTMGKEMGVVVNRAGLGNRDVYQYLENESIPLLGEIPFNKEIAFLYSEGKIAVKELSSLQVIFQDIVNNIVSYGNSSN